MPGLIQKTLQPEKPAAQGAPQEAPQPGGQKADPKSVERVVLAGLKLIHDEKVGPQIIELMKSAGDPVQALSQATLLVMRQLWEKSKQSIPPEVLGEAGVEVMSELAMIANQAKLYQITDEIFQQAAQMAMDEVQNEAAQGAAPAAGAQPAAPAAAPAAQPVPEGV